MARLPNPGSDNGTWGDILNEYLSVEHNPDGTLKHPANFPDLAGSGSPEGAVTATNGKFYYDTLNGSLYFKDSATGSTGWAQVGGFPYDDGSVVPGYSVHTGSLRMFSAGTSRVIISDANAWEGTGNGIYWLTTGVDGNQLAEITLGPNAEYTTQFNADGTTNFPGPITSAGSPLVPTFVPNPNLGQRGGFGADGSSYPITLVDGQNPLPFNEALVLTTNLTSSAPYDDQYMHWDPATPNYFSIKKAGWYVLQSALDVSGDLPIGYTYQWGIKGSNPISPALDYFTLWQADGYVNATVYIPANTQISMYISQFGHAGDDVYASYNVSVIPMFAT